MTTDDLIERLVAERKEHWTSGCSEPGAVAALTKKIDDLYEQRRIERASIGAGSREAIVRRARIEVELERMMSGS